MKSGDVRGGQVADAVGKALLLPEDMKVWQEKRSKHMLENLKRDSILVSFQTFYSSVHYIRIYAKRLSSFIQAVQGIFEAGNRLLETERLLNLSLEENKRLKDFEKSASAKIRAAESAHKSAEAGLMSYERQVVELREKLDREYTTSSLLRVENSELKDAINEARAEVQKAEGGAQSYYDQGFDEVAKSLKSQLVGECNKYFIQGWHKALDKAEVDDASELYDLALRHRPLAVDAPEEHDGEDEENAAEDSMVSGPHEVLKELELADDPEVAEDPDNMEADDQIPMVGVQEGDEDSDGGESLDVVG